MKVAFILTGLVTLLYVLATALQSTAVGAFLVNQGPFLVGGYAALAVLAMAASDRRRPLLVARQRTQPVVSVRPTARPAYAGPNWGVNGVGA